MKSSPGLLESASASLKHFLYLDDYRVASYVSQLKNGLTLIKQLRELSSRGIQDNPSPSKKSNALSVSFLAGSVLALATWKESESKRKLIGWPAGDRLSIPLPWLD